MTEERRRLLRHRGRNTFPHLLSLTFGLCVIATEFTVSAAEGALPVKFRMETNSPRYEIRTPMLVRLTLRNVGEADFHKRHLPAIPQGKGHYGIPHASRCRPAEAWRWGLDNRAGG